MHGQFNCYTVMFISSFSHVRLSLDNKRLLTYLLTYLLNFTPTSVDLIVLITPPNDRYNLLEHNLEIRGNWYYIAILMVKAQNLYCRTGLRVKPVSKRRNMQ